MTPEQAKILLPFIKAFSEGKEIQYRLTQNGPWLTPKHGLGFSHRSEYRVKPKAKSKKMWVNIYLRSATIHNSKKTADDFSGIDRIACVTVSLSYFKGEGLE